MYALCDIATEMGLDKVFVHGLTDGRDTDPKSGLGFLKEDVEYLKNTNARFASIIGSYYGMDRDNNWDRMKLSYDLLTKGKGEATKDILKTVETSYADGLTDEFIKPMVVTDENDKALTTIEEGDVVICFNYRTDRLRQMTVMFTQENLAEHGIHTIPLEWYTMTSYNANFKGINVIFDKDNITNTLSLSFDKTYKFNFEIQEDHQTRQSNLLYIERCNSTFASRLPYYKFPIIWNKWTNIVTQFSSRNHFKNKLKRSILSSYAESMKCSNEYCRDCYTT
jgi:bisphosphoglycerate-independent phosphoglycerate mutase (AlkP superfamily)